MAKKMTQIDEKGMPINAMKIQAILVAFIVLGISLGGKNAESFFDMLILMTNFAMTLPCLFLTISYISFKKKYEIKKSFEIFKNKTLSIIISIIVIITIAFANIFTIIEPIFKGDYVSTIYMVTGPLIFTITALIIYYLGEKNN